MKKFTTLEEDLLKEAARSQNAFEQGFKDANDKLLQIRVALEDYKEKYQSGDWDYINSMEYINEQLDGVLQRLGVYPDSFNEPNQMIEGPESDIQ